MITLADGSCVDNPSWEEVLRALEALDGDSTCFVSLDSDFGPKLMVAGGTAGRYVVSFLVDEAEQVSYDLVDHSLGGADVEILAAGITAEYPGHMCVYLPVVKQAIQYFYEKGAMDPGLTWEEHD